MTRDEILELIRAHLADELQIDPARVTEETHFKRDLEADSLDLYTLVQELEDTYGVRMSDEQAAKVQTVGQAVDFVLEHLPSTNAIGGPDVPRPSQTASPDDSRSNPV
jgi:acyl carrier protein